GPSPLDVDGGQEQLFHPSHQSEKLLGLFSVETSGRKSLRLDCAGHEGLAGPADDLDPDSSSTQRVLAEGDPGPVARYHFLDHDRGSGQGEMMGRSVADG